MAAAATTTASTGTGSGHATVGFWLGVAFAVNYTMGCGFLSLPHAVVESGLVLGPLVALGMAFAMSYSKDLTCDALGRAEALSQMRGITARWLRAARGYVAGDTAAPAGGAAAAAAAGTTVDPRRGSAALAPWPQPSDTLVSAARKFEIGDQFALFFSPHARTIYTLFLSLYMYGSLWSYASVFGSSFAANFGLGDVGPGAPCNMEADPASCRPLYRVYLAIFAVLAVPLSCLDVKEQALVQVIMFGARLLVVLLLTGTVLVAHGCSGVAFSQFGAAHRTADVPLASPAGLGIIIPTCIYAFIYHHSIPILAQPLRDKTSLRAVFSTTIAITGASYLAIGAIVASYFGSDVYAQANLNWRSYVGCMAVDPACEALGNVTAAAAMDGGGSLAARLADSDARSNCYVSSRPPFPAVISYTLLLFPALDVLSAFPLNAVTLGNALMSAVLGEASIIAPADDHPAAEAHGAAGAVVPASDSAGGTPAVAAAAAAIADAVHDDAGSATASVSRRGPGSLNSDDGGADAAAASSGATARPVAGGGIAMGQLRARGASRHAGAGAVGAGDGDGERDSEPLLPAMDTAASGGGARHGHRVAGVGSTRCAWCVSTRRRHRLATTGFRLLASVPAIAGAAFVNNLGTILVFAGMVGVGIAFLIPVLLWVGSISRLRAVTVFAGRALAKVAGVARSSDGDGDTRKQRVGAALPDLPSVARADAGGAAAAEAEAMLAAGASPEVVADAVISRAETSVAPGVVEVWRRTPADPLLRTLYTPAGSLAGTTCGWAYVPEVTFVTAFGVLVYVFAQAIADLR